MRKKRAQAKPRDDAAELRLIADNIPAMSIAYDEHLRCLFANRRFAEFFGLTTASIIGRHLREIIGEDPYQEVKPHFERVLQGQRTTYTRTRVLHSGERRHLEVELTPHLGPDGRTRGLFAVTADVTERRREEQLRLLGHSVAERIAGADSSSAAVQAVIRAICETEHWDCGRYFRPNPDASALRLADAWGIEDAAIREFLRQAKHIEQRSGIGLIGEVWRSGRALWVTEVAKEARALRTAYPKELIAGGTFVFPVTSEGAVIGVLAFNSRERRAPDERLLQVILDIGGQIGQFLQRKQVEQSLRETDLRLRDAHERLRMLVESSPLAIYTRDPDGLLTSWNPAAEKMYGWTAAEVLGKPLPSVPGESRESSDGLRRRLLGGEPFIRHEARRRRRDGSPIDIDAFLGPLRDAAGNINGIMAIVADITDRRRAEQALRDSEAELRLLTDNVPAMILHVDRNMDCVFANRRYADFFGLAAADLVGRPLREIVGDASYRGFEEHFHGALAGRPGAYQRNVQLKSGEYRWIEVKLVPCTADDGQVTGCYAMAIDITEQKQAEERVRHMADHDSLTGLPNRLLFTDRLQQAISAAKRDASRFALLYLDLDRFKPVNDALGHGAGDQLLKGVAARIRALVRESDTVARVGGDEFIVVLRNIASAENGAAVAQKIIAALAVPFRLENQPREVGIGVSIGIAVYPDDARDHEALVKMADAAMYRAKTPGNCFRLCGA